MSTTESLALAAAIPSGMVVTPDDQSWDEARQAWNLAVDQRPAAVAVAESADDVAAVVTSARQHGLRVAAQGTGHAAAPMGSLADTILLKTERLRGVRVDPKTRTARVAAGEVWLNVVGAAAEHGLAALAGSSPDVGVVGYTLGGGLSWLSRTHGLCANNVEAVELVTADGQLRRVDGETDADLFWALRGGGGSFGMAPTPEAKAAVEMHAQTINQAMSRWQAGHMYMNFAETSQDPSAFWQPEAYDRLRRIKADVDPTNLIRSNHPVPPSA